MDIYFYVTAFQIWIFVFLAMLIIELVLTILNILPTINFKWSLRFLTMGKIWALGVLVLIYHLLQGEAWFNV